MDCFAYEDDIKITDCEDVTTFPKSSIKVIIEIDVTNTIIIQYGSVNENVTIKNNAFSRERVYRSSEIISGIINTGSAVVVIINKYKNL